MMLYDQFIPHVEEQKASTVYQKTKTTIAPSDWLLYIANNIIF